MTTPLTVRNFIRDLKSRDFKSIQPHEFEQLCHIVESNLPVQAQGRGKKCPHCSWKIGNAARTCKNCGKSVEKQNQRYIPPVDGINDCKGECAEDLTGREYHQLPCGHKFCCGCMSNRVVRGFRTCCLCDHVRIDETIRAKYLPRVL